MSASLMRKFAQSSDDWQTLGEPFSAVVGPVFVLLFFCTKLVAGGEVGTNWKGVSLISYKKAATTVVLALLVCLCL